MTEEQVEPADTDHETEHQEPRARWGVIASVLVHVPIVALLIFGLPKIQAQPAEEESVKVELVPPPEEKKPEEKPKEEERPKEQAKAEPPPPPPQSPPPTAEMAKQAKPPPMPPMLNVKEFDNRNSGPKKSLTGNSSEGDAKPATTPPPHDVAPEQMPSEAVMEKLKAETPPSKPVPDDVKLPEVAVADASPEPNGSPADMSDKAVVSIEQAKPPEQKTPEKPKEVAKNNDLTNAKTLFSSTEDGNSIAQAAIEGLPRNKRVAVLCASELRAQLAYGSPSYRPYALPQYGLRAGNLLDIDDAAFGTAKGWYHVRFRCEVDTDATKVVSFAHEVGALIPRSQYGKYDIRD